MRKSGAVALVECSLKNGMIPIQRKGLWLTRIPDPACAGRKQNHPPGAGTKRERPGRAQFTKVSLLQNPGTKPCRCSARFHSDGARIVRTELVAQKVRSRRRDTK